MSLSNLSSSAKADLSDLNVYINDPSKVSQFREVLQKLDGLIKLPKNQNYGLELTGTGSNRVLLISGLERALEDFEIGDRGGAVKYTAEGLRFDIRGTNISVLVTREVNRSMRGALPLDDADLPLDALKELASLLDKESDLSAGQAQRRKDLLQEIRQAFVRSNTEREKVSKRSIVMSSGEGHSSFGGRAG